MPTVENGRIEPGFTGFSVFAEAVFAGFSVFSSFGAGGTPLWACGSSGSASVEDRDELYAAEAVTVSSLGAA
jgi:hypothetical protein